jgi:hypothetical protein
MKRHMSMISSKIKFEIDINNDETIGTKWEHFKKKEWII